MPSQKSISPVGEDPINLAAALGIELHFPDALKNMLLFMLYVVYL
jgi:hypothetical protein